MDYKAQEQRLAIFARDRWVCRGTPGGRPCLNHIGKHGTPQLGHIIPQDKMHINMYGKRIIHHQLNMKATCSLRCNASLNIRGKPLRIAALVEKIQKAIDTENK